MSNCTIGTVLKATRISLIRSIMVRSATTALLIALVAWLLGSKLVEPQNHAVPLPAGFEAQSVSIPGSGRAIAGWWVDRGGESPVVLGRLARHDAATAKW